MNRANRHAIQDMSPEQIYEQYRRLVALEASKYSAKMRGRVSFADFCQAGFEALYRKLPDYNPERAEFTSFIMPWVRRAMQKRLYEEIYSSLHYRYGRLARNGRKAYPANAVKFHHIDSLDQDETTAHDWSKLLAVSSLAEERAIFQDLLRKAYNSPDILPRDRVCFFRHYMRGEKLRDIATSLSISHATVRKRAGKVLKQLIQLVEEDNA